MQDELGLLRKQIKDVLVPEAKKQNAKEKVTLIERRLRQLKTKLIEAEQAFERAVEQTPPQAREQGTEDVHVSDNPHALFGSTESGLSGEQGEGAVNSEQESMETMPEEKRGMEQ